MDYTISMSSHMSALLNISYSTSICSTQLSNNSLVILCIFSAYDLFEACMNDLIDNCHTVTQNEIKGVFKAYTYMCDEKFESEYNIK